MGLLGNVFRSRSAEAPFGSEGKLPSWIRSEAEWPHQLKSMPLLSLTALAGRLSNEILRAEADKSEFDLGALNRLDEMVGKKMEELSHPYPKAKK